MDGESSKYDMLERVLQDQSSEPHSVTLEYLRKITNDFSDEQLLGEGGFGKVYKGVLPNAEMVAVKKLDQLKPGVQDRQFENEIYHLMKLEHPNIVRFVGYCYETRNEYVEYEGKYRFAEMQQRLLCLEYLPNRSLDVHLSDESSGLSWDKRYIIIKGICCGLHYLHEECKHQINATIIHLDLKPANILLDENMVPKIADFGLSRLFEDKKAQTCASILAGSFGYMAPEYIYNNMITKKADTYRLGVIIIEIITGSKIYPFSFDKPTSRQDFVERVLKNWRNRLEASPSETDCKQIKDCLEIGLSCVKFDRDERPTTREIVEMLKIWDSTNCNVNKDKLPADMLQHLSLSSSPKDMCESGQTDLSASLSVCDLLPYAPPSQDDPTSLSLDESLAQVCSQSSSDYLMNSYVDRVQEATKMVHYHFGGIKNTTTKEQGRWETVYTCSCRPIQSIDTACLDNGTDAMRYRIALAVIQIINNFQAVERQRLEEPASDVGLESLCALINNNLHCYDLSLELSKSILESFPQNYAGQLLRLSLEQKVLELTQVNFEEASVGFLEVAKEAILQVVTVIYEDPGVQDLLAKLYREGWLNGNVTEYLVATFADYFGDVKLYIEERSFHIFVEVCLKEAIVVYVDHLLIQENHITEETVERMRLDEEVFMDFFREHIGMTVSKLFAADCLYNCYFFDLHSKLKEADVESRVKVLADLRELASAESLESFVLIYTNILQRQPDCLPEVVKKLVALREGIPRRDGNEECKKIYEDSLVDGKPRGPGFVYGKLKCLSGQ